MAAALQAPRRTPRLPLMDDRSNEKRWDVLLLLGMGLGLVVAGGSWAWSHAVSPRAVWSTEQAAEYEAAYEALHSARSEADAHRHPSPNPNDASAQATPEPEMAAAQARYDKISASLDNARNMRERWGRRGVIAGLTLMIGCGIGYFVVRSA